MSRVQNPTSIQETTPIDPSKTNPSFSYVSNAAGECINIKMTVGTTVYTKTYTRSDNVAAGTLPESAWTI